jgi:hypothetical protein
MKRIPGTLLKAPFCKAYRLAAFIPLTFLASCSFVNSSLDYAENYYQESAPFEVTKYDYKTNEKSQLKFKVLDGYKFKISTDEFYVKRSFAISDLLLDRDKEYREAEARRAASGGYLMSQ